MFKQISVELKDSYCKLNPNHSIEDLELFLFDNLKLSKVNYLFKNKSLLFRAFTHKSFAHESKLNLINNERLEFLGDSVLSIIISEYIFDKYKDVKEGDLSKLRSSIVNEDTLFNFAKYINLQEYILLGKGELLNKGFDKKSILSDCFEAFLGAIYLDSDLTTVKEILLNLIFSYEKENSIIFLKDITKAIDPKTELQELIYQKYKVYPKYESIKNEKENNFTVSIYVNENKIDQIVDHSKKTAMQLLAKKILQENII